MIITSVAKKIELSSKDKAYIEVISKQLANYFTAVISVRWKLSLQRKNIIAKCVVHSISGYYRAQAGAITLKQAVSLVFDKITKQRRRKKEIQKKVIKRSKKSGNVLL